jgi:hypothetical protein
MYVKNAYCWNALLLLCLCFIIFMTSHIVRDGKYYMFIFMFHCDYSSTKDCFSFIYMQNDELTIIWGEEIQSTDL